MSRIGFILKHIGNRLNMLSLSNRLSVFLSLLISIIIFGVFFALLFSNILSPSPSALKKELQVSLDEYTNSLSEYYSNTAAQGILLSQHISQSVEELLSEQHVSFDALNDNPKLIETVEEKSYTILSTALRIADCSGAFVVFDATVNTKLQGAESSRCGVYIRLDNISISKPVNPDFTWLRGVYEIGAKHRHVFHNKWELEFNLDNFPFYHTLKQHAEANLANCFYYSPKMKLPGTWESMMWLCVPLVGSHKEFYGICGFEISSLYFKLKHTTNKNDAQNITGLIAQKQDDFLLPATGLESGTASGYFADLGSSPLKTEKILRGLNRYSSQTGTFVGLDKPLRLSPLDNTEWSVATFIPKDDYNFITNIYYLEIVIICIIFFCLALVLSHYLRRMYIKPVLSGINAMKKGEKKTSILEIDDLISFLQEQEAQKQQISSDADMTGFVNFQNNIEKLSNAERNVFNLYLEGYSAQEIADKLFISINTVKSHNRRIYTKLEISSRKELLIYAKMLKKEPEKNTHDKKKTI